MKCKTINSIKTELETEILNREEHLIHTIFSFSMEYRDKFYQNFQKSRSSESAIDLTIRQMRSKGYYFVGEQPKHPVFNPDGLAILGYRSGYIGCQSVLLFTTTEVAKKVMQIVQKEEKNKNKMIKVLPDIELPSCISQIRVINSIKEWKDL